MLFTIKQEFPNSQFLRQKKLHWMDRIHKTHLNYTDISLSELVKLIIPAFFRVNKGTANSVEQKEKNLYCFMQYNPTNPQIKE